MDCHVGGEFPDAKLAAVPLRRLAVDARRAGRLVERPREDDTARRHADATLDAKMQRTVVFSQRIAQRTERRAQAGDGDAAPVEPRGEHAGTEDERFVVAALVGEQIERRRE